MVWQLWTEPDRRVPRSRQCVHGYSSERMNLHQPKDVTGVAAAALLQQPRTRNGPDVPPWKSREQAGMAAWWVLVSDRRGGAPRSAPWSAPRHDGSAQHCAEGQAPHRSATPGSLLLRKPESPIAHFPNKPNDCVLRVRRTGASCAQYRTT